MLPTVTHSELTTSSLANQAPASETKRKRERHVLSCLSCRHRKVRCDREYPVCGRCEKGGNAKSCTYKSRWNSNGEVEEDEVEVEVGDDERVQKRMRLTANGSGSILNVPATSSEYVKESPLAVAPLHEITIRRLESRLADLERVVARGSVVSPRDQPPVEVSLSKEVVIARKGKETNLFKGQGFRTQFYGASSPTSLLAHFPEVRQLMMELHKGSELERLQSEESDLEAKYGKREKNQPKEAKPNLVGLVPERSKVDRLVHLYFDTFDKTYRILHIPSFWNEYETFWKSPQDSPPGFVAVLLMVISTVNCMTDEPSSWTSGGSTASNEAVVWIRACDAWMSMQSQKHRFIEMYQVLCLRVLAVSANCHKTKEVYLGAESMLNYFKAAGFHRDPAVLHDRCSPFDAEMRRRLWATAVELELQAAIDRGTPSALSGYPVDCMPPLNIDDGDLTPQTSQLPPPMPTNQYTSTSYLHVSSKSLPLRITLCAIVNNPSSQIRHDEVLRYEQDITDALSEIPKWSNSQNTHTSALLELQLRQYLLMLHMPFARTDGNSSSRYSRMMCFETSQNILELHSTMLRAGNFTLTCTREDVFRAALALCHNAFLCTLKPNNYFFSGAIATFPQNIEDIFKLLEERCMRRGRGLHQYWYVSAASSLVEMQIDGYRAASTRQSATDRVAKLYHRILKSWKESLPGDAVVLAQAPRLPPSEPPAAISYEYSPGNLGFFDAPKFGIEDFDSSDWTLDNLWPMDADYGILN